MVPPADAGGTDDLMSRRECHSRSGSIMSVPPPSGGGYYNQSFVVMEYFGYLRRDPDALYLD